MNEVNAIPWINRMNSEDCLDLPEQAKNHKPMVSIGSRTNSSIVCGVDANPPATKFTWTKNGHFVGTYDKVLFL